MIELMSLSNGLYLESFWRVTPKVFEHGIILRRGSLPLQSDIVVHVDQGQCCACEITMQGHIAMTTVVLLAMPSCSTPTPS